MTLSVVHCDNPTNGTEPEPAKPDAFVDFLSGFVFGFVNQDVDSI